MTCPISRETVPSRTVGLVHDLAFLPTLSTVGDPSAVEPLMIDVRQNGSGPQWGYLWAEDPKVHKMADWRIDSLTELPALIEAARA